MNDAATTRPLGPGTAVGFVGLGRMGAPMSRRLVQAGYAVTGYDADRDALSRCTSETGAAAGAALADVGAEAAAVILMLPDSAAVRSVLVDDDLLGALGERSLVIDMGSSEPEGTRELHGTLARVGVRLVDAPVSGGVPGAEAGTLTVMAGGHEADVEACRPVFEALGERVLHVGPVAAGHALKALNNLLGATTLMASVEALDVGVRFGLDPLVMLEAINGSTGRSWSTEHKLPKFVVPRRYDSGFGLGLVVKDMRIALGLARATGAAMPLGEAALDLWEQAQAELAPDADHTEVARWVERRLDG